MKLREFDPSGDDAERLAAFTCSTGAVFENEVEDWVRMKAVDWVNDVPRAMFQRRVLAMIEKDDAVLAIAAWQDIVRVDLEGIWLEALAVDLDHQHQGAGREVYSLVTNRLRTIERDGNHLAGLVHNDNMRSQRLLESFGWTPGSAINDHGLWAGRL